MAIQFVRAQLKDALIDANKLDANAVVTAKIQDSNVTLAKIADVADNRVLGNMSGSAAAPSELVVDDALSSNAANLASSAAIKTYVDAEIADLAGSSWKDSVIAATTAALAANYANGSAGVGATLTGTGNGAITLDGVTLVSTMRVLVKNGISGGNGKSNGIYTVTTVGDAGNPFVLTRATDADTAAEIASAVVVVEQGTVGNGQAWYVPTYTQATIDGTSAIQFARFRQLSGGDGLKITSKDGAQDDLEIDFDSGKGLEIVSNKLEVKVKSESGGTITRDADGLYIADSAISNAKLANSTISGKALGTNLDSLSKATNSGLAMSSFNGSAAVSDLALDLNDLSALGDAVNPAADSFAIIDASDSATSKKKGIADLVTAITGNGLNASSGVQAVLADGVTIAVAGSGIKVADGQIDTLQLKDDGVSFAKLGIIPNSEVITGTGATAYALAQRVPASQLAVFEDSVRVFYNGQRIENVGASGTPADIQQYKVEDTGSATRIVLGAALSSPDKILVDYWYE